MFAAVIAALAAAASPAPAPEDPRAALADLQQVYQQSCENRAYGSYNDICAEMRRQIRDYRREAAAQGRAPKPLTPPTPLPTPSATDSRAPGAATPVPPQP